MNVWKILDIDKTQDKKAIKKAYLSLLKNCPPEDNPTGFMELREAYETALELADSIELYDDEIYETEENDFDASDNQTEALERDSSINEWINRVREIYNNVEKSFNIGNWRRLLYEDLPIQIKYNWEAKKIIEEQMLRENLQLYIPDNIIIMIGEFFDYMGNGENDKNIFDSGTKYLKLKDKVRFDLVDVNVNREIFDDFISTWNMFAAYLMEFYWDDAQIGYLDKNVLVNQYDIIWKYINGKYENLFYLPLEVIKISSSFDRMTREELCQRLMELKETALRRLRTNPLSSDSDMEKSVVMYIQLIEAEYYIYEKDNEHAEEILIRLYDMAPVKDYVFLYLLSIALKRAGKYYAAYRCIYIFTYLCPDNEIYDVMKRFKAEIIKENCESLTSICRLYVDDAQSFVAAEHFDNIIDKDKASWEYNVLWYLISNETGDKEGADKSYEKLSEYPREELSPMKLLEWRVMQLVHKFTEGLYNECIDGCNTFLLEYPNAYDTDLLRMYADFAKFKRIPEAFPRTERNYLFYINIKRLISVNNESPRARLLMVSTMNDAFVREYKYPLRLLEPVRDKYPVQYKYFQLLELYDNTFKEFCDESFRFIKNNINNNISIIRAGICISLYDITNVLIERYAANVNNRDVYNLCNKFIDKQFKSDTYYENKLRFKLSFIYGEDEQALNICNILLQNEKERDFYRRSKVDLLFFMGRNDEAIKEFEMCDEESKAILYDTIAEYYMDIRDIEKAEKYYRLSIETIFDAGGNIRATVRSYLHCAEFYHKIKRNDEAFSIIQECIDLYGENEDVYFSLKDIYIEEGDFDEAIKCIERINELTGEQSVKTLYHFMYGIVYGFKHEYEKSIYEYNKAIEEECPRNCYANLSYTYYCMGDYKMAAEYIQKSMEKKYNIYMYQYIILVRFFLNKNGERSKIIDDFLKEENIEKVIKELNETMNDSIEDMSESLITLGIIYGYLGEFEKAEEIAGEYMEYSKSDEKFFSINNYYDLMARLCAFKGNLEEAIAWINKSEYADNPAHEINDMKLKFEKLSDEERRSENDIRN